MQGNRPIELNCVQTLARADIQPDANSPLVQVGFTVGRGGCQTEHSHDGISLKHHNPDVGNALEGVLGECRGGLNQVFNNGNIRGTGQGIQASQNIGKVTLQHGDGNAGAGGLDKVVAVSPGNHGNALAARAFCWLDGETGQILCHFPKMGDFVLLANHLQQLGGFYAVFADRQLGFQLVVHQRVGGAIIVPGNVIYIAPVHVQHPEIFQPAWRDPVHISRRPSSG